MPSESAADFQRRLCNVVAQLAFDAVFYLTGGASAVGTPQEQRDRIVQGLEHIQNVLDPRGRNC